MPVKKILQDVIDRFHERVEKDPGLRKELQGIKKRVNVDLGAENYHFLLDEAHIHDFQEGLLSTADITLISDPQTVEDLYTGKMKIMKAYALRKIRVKGSLEDVMRLRALF